MNIAMPIQSAAPAHTGIRCEAVRPWLEHLAHMFPITHALVIGAGKGSSSWIRFLLESTKNPVTLVEAGTGCFMYLRRAHAKRAGWSLLNQLVAPAKGPATYHRFPMSSESGLMDPASLQEIWPRLQLLESVPAEATSLDEILISLSEPADWLFIDCYPSAALLRSCKLGRSSIQVIVARVTRGCHEPHSAGSSIDTVTACLEKNGFQFLSFEPGNNPKTGYALFFRKPSPRLDFPPAANLAELNERWLRHIRSLSVSQLGQDLWVLERCSFKRGGFFVEFGATDGISLSNTFLLEKEFGWNGICAEPNPRYFAELVRNRICTHACECIGGVTGEQVEFVFASEYGGMVRDMDKDNHKDRRRAYLDSGQTGILTTISLHDFLIKHNAPRTIDYLSIDTEGSELSILETFPFDCWDIRHITVEHNYTEQRQAIRKLLTDLGYQVKEAEWDDWYYFDDSHPPVVRNEEGGHNSSPGQANQ